MYRCRFIMAKKVPTVRVRDCRTASTSTRPSGTGSDEHHAYCKDFVQKHDYEAYIVSQLYPIEKRNGYFAIKAFYVCL
jgi:NADH dehydrogenase [ubiquinone] 1 alpha subcomplex assembly factor 6